MAGDIGPDDVYREMYLELRRYRDMEQYLARWYTAVLLAITGGYIALVSQGVRLDRVHRFGAIAVIVILTALVVTSLNYLGERYVHMRRYVRTELEPWPWGKYTPPPRKLSPRVAMTIAIFVLAVSAALLFAFFPAAELGSQQNGGHVFPLS